MLRKKDRTLETYMKAGAKMRLYKTLGTKLFVDISKVLSAQDKDKLERAMNKIDEVCANAEDNMFNDYPDLSDHYVNVFYGSTKKYPVNDLDEKMLKMAREAANELFVKNENLKECK